MSSSAGVKNAARLAREQNYGHKRSLLPPFDVGRAGPRSPRTAAPRIPESPPVSQTGLTWRVTPSLLSQRRRRCPKETESRQLKLLVGHKRQGGGGGGVVVRRESLLTLSTILLANNTIGKKRLVFFLCINTKHFPQTAR